MTPREALEALERLAEIAFAGRVLLSLLPPGLPGRHRLPDLPATWAASHVLGGIALAIEARVFDLAGLDPSRPVLLAPWLLLALGRWVTLPGAMVPRHEPIPEVVRPAARAIATAGFLAIVATALLAFDRSGWPDPAVLADALAMLAACGHGLFVSRRSPLARATTILALASVLAFAIATSSVSAFPLATLLGAGAAFAGAWLRRGDRRAAALAVVAFAGAGLLGFREALFGAAGLFALCLHTPAPSRRSVILPSAVSLAVCAALGWTSLRDARTGAPAVDLLTAAVLVGVAAALTVRKQLVGATLLEQGLEGGPDAPSQGIEATRVERNAARDAVLLSVLPLAARGELSAVDGLAYALLPLAPMVAYELGLWLGPPEAPLVRASPESGSRRR